MPKTIDSTTPLYSSRVLANYTNLLRARYPQVDVAAVLRDAGLRPEELADQGHWFSQAEVNRFHEVLISHTGNPNISRESGRHAAAPESIGVMRAFVLGLSGPGKTYAAITKVAAQFTRAAVFTARQRGKHQVEVVVTPNPGVQMRPFQCNNQMGFMEAVALIFNYEAPQIEHPECVFKGGSCCRYLISWRPSLAETLRRLRVLLQFPALLATVAFALLTDGYPCIIGTFSLAGLFLLFAFYAEHAEKVEARTIVNELREPTNLLLEQINANYTSARLINEVGQALSHQTGKEAVIATVLELMAERIGFERGALFLVDAEARHLQLADAYGLEPAQRELFAAAELPLDLPAERTPMTFVFASRQPLLIASRQEYETRFPQANHTLVAALAGEAFLCCPVVCDGEAIGVLLADNGQSGRQLLQTDLHLLQGLAPIIGVSIRNAELLATKERQFNAILELERVARELVQAKGAAEALAAEVQLANDDVRSFAYIVSHDLRAPLVNIKGFAAELAESFALLQPVLVEALATLPPERAAELREAAERDIPEALGFIAASVGRMDGLISAILKLSRLGHRELRPVPVDAAAVFQATFATLTHQLESRQVELSVAAGPPVLADPTAVEQVVGNLCDNAVKYLEPGRPGRIAVTFARTAGEVVIAIADNGRGIAAADLGKVFEIFRRAGRQDTQGEGMGLAYVKALVRRMGGRIWCESELGTGTTFFVALPAAD